MVRPRRRAAATSRRSLVGLTLGLGLVSSLLLVGTDAPGEASPAATPIQVAAVVSDAAPRTATTASMALDLPTLERLLLEMLPASLHPLATPALDAGLDASIASAVTPAVKDSDKDGVPDAVERRTGTDPHKRDTDGDGVPDGLEDPDHDGLNTLFELRRTKTDPGDPDSDNDGIRDGAEDPDGDKLSNRGEQKYGTSPHKADTNGDGQDDWHEDRDHDGIVNGMEQDSFRLPTGLTPKLTKANEDVPVSAAEQCHSRRGQTKPGSCSYLKHGTKLVLIIGDSHAVHWFPAIYRVAKERGWRLISMTKSACPFADVPSIRDGKRDTACAIWRKKAFAKVKRLHPDLVIASALDGYKFVGDQGHPTSPRSEALWGAGLKRSLVTLRKASDKVIMLGDVQDWGSKALSCLARNRKNVAACESRANLKVQVRREATARKAAAAAKVRFASTRKLSCPYDPCPLVVDRYLVTRDGGHLTATYAALLWRGMDRLLPDL